MSILNKRNFIYPDIVYNLDKTVSEWEAKVTKLSSQNAPYRILYIGLVYPLPGGGGNSAYEGDGDARRKFSIKPLKETDLGMAQAFFWTPKETMLKQRQYTF